MFSLIGQSSASMMMSCDMINMSDMPMSHSMDSAEHSMDMSMDASTTTSITADCCQENCDCATASCNPNSYTNSLTTLAITPLYSDSSNQEVALPQTQFLNYLFKASHFITP